MTSYPFLFDSGGCGSLEILTDDAAIARVEAIMGERLRAEGLPPEWARVGVVHEDQYIKVLRDAVRFPDNKVGTYFRVLAPPLYTNVVAVLPVVAGRIMLLRHFRHATRSWHLEIPRGRTSESESLEEVARRELREETGAETSFLTALGPLHSSSGLTSESAELLLAAASAPGRPERAEGITEVLVVTVGAFEDMIGSGAITDSFTVAAYTRAKLRGFLDGKRDG